MIWKNFLNLQRLKYSQIILTGEIPFGISVYASSYKEKKFCFIQPQNNIPHSGNLSKRIFIKYFSGILTLMGLIVMHNIFFLY